jgi:hypothetical protein
MQREPSRRVEHGPGLGGWLPAALVAAALCAPPAVAQAQPATKAFENAKFQYSVSLPAGCRHEEGPGTLEAVCSADFDADKSATASAAASLILSVSAEAVSDSAGKPPAELAQSYGEARFREEIPESVCGESDRARVKIDNVRQVLEETRVVYTADVLCPEIKFLHLGERRAVVRHLITPGLNYRLMGRAPKEDFAQKKPSVDAFLESFRVTPPGK